MTAVTALVVVVIGGLGIAVALRSPAPPPMPGERKLKKYCPNCGSLDIPQFQKSGSAAVEVLLWLFFLLPGIIYSIWRVSTKRWVCPVCEQVGMIPLDSPLAKSVLQAKS